MRAVVLALALLGALAGPLRAQDPDDLGRFLDRLITLWQRGDAVGLVELGARSGLDLEVRGDPIGPLSGRRAVAELRHIFEGQQTVAVRTGTPSRVIGTDNRAFVELTWEVRMSGAPFGETSIIFLGFVRESTGWKVSQIRILP
jgi:hypothetical protein